MSTATSEAPSSRIAPAAIGPAPFQHPPMPDGLVVSHTPFTAAGVAKPGLVDGAGALGVPLLISGVPSVGSPLSVLEPSGEGAGPPDEPRSVGVVDDPSP